MVIRPFENDPSRRIPASGAEAAPAQPALKRAAETPPAPPSASTDSAELSSAARELFARLEAPSPSAPALSPERTHAVLARIRSGHYDRAEVLDQVARKVQAGITDSNTDH
jgi:hypothetical protein